MEWYRNFRRFGVIRLGWVSNEGRDPSTAKMFKRGRPAATWKHTSKDLEGMGLYGFYRT